MKSDRKSSFILNLNRIFNETHLKSLQTERAKSCKTNPQNACYELNSISNLHVHNLGLTQNGIAW